MTNRMASLPLTADRKETEWQKILSIAENNQFPLHHKTRLKRYTQHKTHEDKTHDKNKKWVIFTFHSPKVRKITHLFKQTDVEITFKSTNTIQQQTRPKNHGMTPDHNNSGIYKMKCKTCNRAYIGQTSHKLSLRFRSSFCKPLKNEKIRRLSVQPGLRKSNDLRVGRKMATFQLFIFQSKEQQVVRRGRAGE